MWAYSEADLSARQSARSWPGSSWSAEMRPPPNSSQTAHEAAVGVIEGGDAEARSTALNLFTQESFSHNFPLLPVVNYPYLTKKNECDEKKWLRKRTQ